MTDPQHIHNRATERYLSEVMDARGYNEGTLAKRTGISRGTISRHFTGQRPISREHLGAYMQALEPHLRNGLMAAWLQDLGQDGQQIMKRPRKPLK